MIWFCLYYSREEFHDDMAAKAKSQRYGQNLSQSCSNAHDNARETSQEVAMLHHNSRSKILSYGFDAHSDELQCVECG